MKDFNKILSRGVDEQNRTTYTIENLDGEIETVLYSEIDQKKVRDVSQKEPRFATVIRKSSGDKLVIESHDKNGNKSSVDIELERDKFINPEKYAKKDKKA